MKASSETTEGRGLRRPAKEDRTRAPADSSIELPTGRRSPSRRKWYILASAILLLAVVVVFWRRSSAVPPAPVAAPVVVMEASRIRFTEEFATRHRVGSAIAEETELAPTIQVMGTVHYDVRKYAAVGARSAGRVRRVLKIAGDTVKPGDILADIESVELGKVQAAAESLRARELAAKTNLAREQQLAEAKVTAKREAEAAKAEFDALRAERLSAERAVSAMGSKLGGELGVLPLRTPIAGRVLSAKASRGLTVEPSDTLFEVADLSTVWVELMVFERDLDRIREGDAVEIMPAAATHTPVRGTVALVGQLIDPETRSAIVRVEIDNRQGLLRPGQSTSARIHSRGPVQRVLTVPKSALTFVDSKPTVLVLASPGLVEPRAVELGADDGERVCIKQGLRAGERVITDGLFALKSEIYR